MEYSKQGRRVRAKNAYDAREISDITRCLKNNKKLPNSGDKDSLVEYIYMPFEKETYPKVFSAIDHIEKRKQNYMFASVLKYFEDDYKVLKQAKEDGKILLPKIASTAHDCISYLMVWLERNSFCTKDGYVFSEAAWEYINGRNRDKLNLSAIDLGDRITETPEEKKELASSLLQDKVNQRTCRASRKTARENQALIEVLLKVDKERGIENLLYEGGGLHVIPLAWLGEDRVVNMGLPTPRTDIRHFLVGKNMVYADMTKDMPFEDGAFSCVFVYDMIHYLLPNIEKTNRILAEDGVYILNKMHYFLSPKKAIEHKLIELTDLSNAQFGVYRRAKDKKETLHAYFGSTLK